MLTDLFMIASACLFLGLFAGYLWGHQRGSAPWREEQRQREIERRLLGRTAPKHRATAEPAVIRSARVVGSKVWRP